MGYASSLPIDEFRSIEQMLDGVCTAVMPPVVAAYGVQASRAEFGGVPGVLYLPPGRDPHGVILYLHGGGYIGTSPRMYSFFTAPLCRETGCAVFVADYRLAPEFPFPAGVEDAAAVLSELTHRGVPIERTFVAGDSGGGGLANTLILRRLAQVDATPPAGLILFSPEVDLELDEPSVTENAALDILPWNIPTAAYLHGVDPDEGFVGAAYANLTGFPPTFVTWGADEMFRDPIRRYVKRLDHAGVTNYACEVPGMFHVFPILVPWAGEPVVYDEVRPLRRRLVADHPTYENATDRTATDDGAAIGRGAPDEGPPDTDDTAHDGGNEGRRRPRSGEAPPPGRAVGLDLLPSSGSACR